MAEIISDRVKEQSTSTGTGNLTLGGAMVGFRAFNAVCSPGDTFPGSIVAVDNLGNPTGQWETGTFKYVNSTTIERTIVSLSSNNDQKVDFTAGIKHIFIDLTAFKVVAMQGSGLLKNPQAGGSGEPPPDPPPPNSTNQLRYIRDYANGSAGNFGSHWVEIRVIGTNGQNISSGKAVTTSVVPSYGDPSIITNGNLNTDEYVNLSDGGLQWVQVDLGAVHSVQSVTVWHYFGDGRTYNGTKTMGSADGATWFTIFDSATSGTYPETSAGKTTSAPFNATPTGSNTGGSGGTINTAQFHVGMHFHRLYNNGGEAGPGYESDEPTYGYGLFRDWDCENLHCASVWTGVGSINTALIEQVYSGHAANGAKVIKTFGTVPTWAAKRPTEPNIRYPSYVGGMSGPANLTQYKAYVQQFVTTFGEYLWAVEGWNEPYPYSAYGTPDPSDGDEWPQYSTMTPTELADHQKAVYQGAKAANPNILVFGPAQAYIAGFNDIFEARTSQGEPITQFFDVVSWHPYNRDKTGIASAGYTLDWEVTQLKQIMAAHGVNKPIADTEHGWIGGAKEGADWWYAGSTTSAQRAQVIYDTLAEAKRLGLLCVCLYSHETELIDFPETKPVVANKIDEAFINLDTKWS